MERFFDLEAARAGDSFYVADRGPSAEVTTHFVGELPNGTVCFVEHTEDRDFLVITPPEQLRMTPPHEVFVNLYLKLNTLDEIIVGPSVFDDEEEALECGPDVAWATYLRTVAVELPA